VISERLTDMFMMSYLTTDHAIRNGQSRGSGRVMKNKYIMHNIQDWNVLCDNTVRPVICEDSQFIHM
jgi:hypothetical protein